MNINRIAGVRALTNYFEALIDLYRQDRSLLEGHGIFTTGREPVIVKK